MGAAFFGDGIVFCCTGAAFCVLLHMRCLTIALLSTLAPAVLGLATPAVRPRSASPGVLRTAVPVMRDVEKWILAEIIKAFYRHLGFTLKVLGVRG